MAFINGADKLRMALAYSRVSLRELGRRTGQTSQNLTQRLQRDSITTHELNDLAKAIGAELEITFVFPDGTRI